MTPVLGWLAAELDRVWLRPGGATRRDLLAGAQAIAACLRGDAPPRLVVLACREARHFVPGLLGAWLAGATVELLPNVQPATLERVDADARIARVLHDLPAARQRSAKGLFVPDVIATGAHAVLTAAPTAAPDALRAAVRLTTSGTTGAAQPVTKTLAQLVDEVEVLAAVLPTARAVLSTVPLSHLYGLLFGALLPLRQGSVIVSHEGLLWPGDLGALVEAEAVDRLISTPAHLRALAAASMPAGLQVVSSGGRLPPELHLALASRHGWQVTDVLGSTETGGIATRGQPRGAWTPLPGVHVRAGRGGALHVRSPWCDGGAAVLDDQVALLEDGTFRHLGRAGDVIKIAGKRADAGALEATVRALPGVEDVAVLLHSPAPGREPRVALAVVRAVGAGPSPGRADLVAAIRREFDAVFAPRVVRFVASLPRTERGKLTPAATAELLGSPRAAPLDHLPLRRVAAGRYHADVPPDLVFFQGHFDGLPILPGIVLVDRIIWPIIRAELPEVSRVRAVRRLRFRRPVLPEQELAVQIETSGARVTFEISCAGEIVASGQLFVV